MGARHDRPRLLGDEGHGRALRAPPRRARRARARRAGGALLARVRAAGKGRDPRALAALPPRGPARRCAARSRPSRSTTGTRCARALAAARALLDARPPRLPPGHLRLAGRRARAARRRTQPRPLLPRGDRGAARRRPPHRPRARRGEARADITDARAAAGARRGLRRSRRRASLPLDAALRLREPAGQRRPQQRAAPARRDPRDQRARQRGGASRASTARSPAAASWTACACSRRDVVERARTQQAAGIDPLLGIPLRMGLGFWLSQPRRAGLRASVRARAPSAIPAPAARSASPIPTRASASATSRTGWAAASPSTSGRRR